MEIDTCFWELKSKYGENFCWYRVKADDSRFAEEAYREIGQNHPLFGMKMSCLAKSERNDDILFCTEHGQFVLIHLTYSENNIFGYPRYRLFDTHQELKVYWKQEVDNDK